MKKSFSRKKSSSAGSSQTYSHTRTNSSSSSASSAVESPNVTRSTRTLSDSVAEPGGKAPQSPPQMLIPPGAPPSFNSPGSRASSLGSPSGSPSMTKQFSHSPSSYQYTASEAAAMAALRNTTQSDSPSLSSSVMTGSNMNLNAPSIHNEPLMGSGYSSPNLQGPSVGGGIPPITRVSTGSASSATSNQSPKLSASAAAAASAVFAARPKESALAKAKMFARQATKPHSQTSSGNSHNPLHPNKTKKGLDLTIQTTLPVSLPSGRPSLSERSPLMRPSRELERIASIGSSLDVLGTASPPTGREIAEKALKHHLTFRPRKDAHGLSSSFSNSKLVSDHGSIYSFNPSSPGMAPLELKNLGSREEREQVLEGSWSLLRARILRLCSRQGLRVPVEDLNSLVLMHLTILVQQGGTARMIMHEFRDLLQLGMYNMDVNLQKVNDEHLLASFVEVWHFFFNDVTPYLEAIFLPLQAEFQGAGRIVTGTDHAVFWKDLIEHDSPLDTRRFILMSFRDCIVLPVVDRLEAALTRATPDFETSSASETAMRILQCTNVLSSIQSSNMNQGKIDHLALVVRNSWLSRPRMGKDRRGVVMGRN